MSAEPGLRQRFERAVNSGVAAALQELFVHRDALQDVVNAPIFGFDCPAIVAVADRNDVELLDALLQLGADPNARSQWWAGGFHALYSASQDVAARLFDAGAVPDACAAAHLDRLDLLSDMIARDPLCVHQRGGDGQTPLHFARSRELVDLLLDNGADIDARDVDHRSSAAEWMLGDASDPGKSRLGLARYLVERGASTDIFLASALGESTRVRDMLAASPSLLTLRTGQGDYGEKPPSSFHIYLWTIGANLTPMQTAARFSQHEVLDVMRGFATAEQRLLLACHEGNREEALAIVGDHPGIVQHLGPDDRRALTDEAWMANAKAVELMLELGFDPSVPSVSGPTGGTALHCAAWEGSVACVDALLRHPSGRALLAYGGTPVDWCRHGAEHCGNVQANHAAVERLLLAAMP